MPKLPIQCIIANKPELFKIEAESGKSHLMTEFSGTVDGLNGYQTKFDFTAYNDRARHICENYDMGDILTVSTDCIVNPDGSVVWNIVAIDPSNDLAVQHDNLISAYNSGRIARIDVALEPPMLPSIEDIKDNRIFNREPGISPERQKGE